MCDAGSSPTRTVARPTWPSSATEAATSSRTFAPSALPSMIVAVTAARLPRSAPARSPPARIRSTSARSSVVRESARRDPARTCGRRTGARRRSPPVPRPAARSGAGSGRCSMTPAVLRRAGGRAATRCTWPCDGSDRPRAPARTRRRTRRDRAGAPSRDVDVEHAVAVVLELEPAELGELPVPDQLDPLDLPAARLAAARPVQCDVAGQRLERGAGLLSGEGERPVPGLQLRDPRDEGLRERIVLETKLH